MQSIVVSSPISLILLTNYHPLLVELPLRVRLEWNVGLLASQYLRQLHIVLLLALLCGQLPKDGELLDGFLLVDAVEVLEVARDDLTEDFGFEKVELAEQIDDFCVITWNIEQSPQFANNFLSLVLVNIAAFEGSLHHIAANVIQVL